MPKIAQHWTTWKVVLLLLGVALFAYLIVSIGVTNILNLLLAIGWDFATIAVLYFGHQATRTIAYWYCARVHHPVSYLRLLRIRFSGEAIQFLTFSGIFLSLPAQALILKQSRFTTTQAFAATATDYILFYLTSSAMTLGALLYMLHAYEIAGAYALAARFAVWAAGAFLAASAIAIAMRFYLIGTILNAAASLPPMGTRLKIDPKNLRATEDLLFLVLRNPRRLAITLALHVLAQAFLVIELAVLLNVTNPAFTIAQLLTLEGASKVMGMAFFFVPGQVGASEGAYAALGNILGLSATTGFTIALARRLRNMLLAAAGLAFLSLPKRSEN